MELVNSCIIVKKYTNHFINIDLEPLFDNTLLFFLKFENPFLKCTIIKTTLSPTTSAMEEHFATLKNHNHHKYYNTMY
jgi:hypothetical protein